MTIAGALLLALAATACSFIVVGSWLTVFEGQISKVSYNLLMAGSLIAVVPVLAVALVAQRRVVEGLTLGAVR